VNRARWRALGNFSISISNQFSKKMPTRWHPFSRYLSNTFSTSLSNHNSLSLSLSLSFFLSLSIISIYRSVSSHVTALSDPIAQSRPWTRTRRAHVAIVPVRALVYTCAFLQVYTDVLRRDTEKPNVLVCVHFRDWKRRL